MANSYIRFDQRTGPQHRILQSQRVLFLCCFMFLMGLMPGFTQTSTTISTTKDTHAYEDNNGGGAEANDNNGSCDGLAIANEQDYITNAFIEFGLGSIPSGSTVTSAQLIVTHQNWSYWGEGGGSVTFSPRRITQSWVEGDQCGGNATGSQVNWSNQPTYTGSYGNVTGSAGDADGTDYTFDVTSLVQGWVDGTFPNYGVALIPNSITGTGYFGLYSETGGANAPRLVVTYQQAPQLSTSVTNATCPEDMTGAIDLTVTGGTSPYTYIWSNGATTQDISGLNAGTYSVTVTDNNGATATTSATVSSVNSTADISGAVIPVSSPGATDGAIDITLTGGTSPFSYSWSNGATTQDITGLAEGSYTVSVTEGTGCVTTAIFTVTDGTLANKQLYLSNGQTLDRIDPVNSGDNTTASSPELRVGGTETIVVENSTSTASTGDVSSISTSHTVTAANSRLLMATVALGKGKGAPTITSMTYNGQNMQLVGTRNAGNDDQYLAMYSLLNPPTGSGTVSATFDDASNRGTVIGAVSFSGVDQTTPYGAFFSNDGSGNSASTSVTSASGELIFDAFMFRNKGDASASATSGSGQTTRFNSASNDEIRSGASTKAGTSSTTMNWSFGASVDDWATGAVSLKPASSTPNPTESFTQSPVLCSPLTILGGETITVQAYTTVTEGTMPGTPSISATIRYGGTTIATLTNPTYNGTSGLLTWTTTLGGDVTVPAGQAIVLDVTTAQSGVAFTIDYDSQTDPSLLDLPVSTFINVDQLAIYDAPYPGGSIVTTAVPGSTVYLRSVVSDPFGVNDITGLDLTIQTPGGGSSTVASTSVATAGCTRTYESPYTIPAGGDYTITATAAEGLENTVFDTETITLSSCNVTASVASQTNVLCFGESTGSVTISATGGTSPYEYSLNGGTFQASNIFSGLAAGSYMVTARDANGCTDNVSFTITQPASVVSGSVASQTNVACFGESTGSVSIAASGGTSPYEYSLNGGTFGTSNTFSSLTAGSYTVTVRDANGCTDDVAFTITQPATAVSASVSSQTNVACFGESTGSVSIGATGGTSPYEYSLDGGAFQTFNTFSALAAGSYTVTVRDASGCTDNISFTITQPGAALSVTPTITQPSCFDFGSISLSISGGTSSYTYNWADVTGTNNPKDRTGLSPGDYSVTVTDANGCTVSSGTLTLNAPVDCAPFKVCTNDPITTFSVTPDPANDSYQWTVPTGAFIVSGQGTPEITVDWTGVTAGAYSVCVVAVNVCGTSDPVCQDVDVVEPPSPIATVDPVCEGDVIQFSATGGDEYSWTGPNGFTSFSANPIILDADPALHDGTYTVTVTKNGCSSTTTVDVMVGTPPSLSLVSSPSACGAADGAIDLTVSGGTPGFTYLWSNGATSEDLTNLAAGGYFVTVTDANGCTATDGISVGSTSGPSTSVTQVNVSCAGGTDGSADLSISGGTTPYTIQWSTGATTEDISGLSAGNYSVTITDAEGCSASETVTITQPNSINLDFTKVNVNCFGAATGSIDLIVSGGTPGYTYAWSDGSATSQDRTGLTAGTYTVTVTDANGCTEMATIEITGPTVAFTATPNVTDVTCFGDSDGQITLSVSGGTSPYTYAWSGPNSFTATTKDIFNRPAGSYSVTVTDANGCTTTATGIMINQPTALTQSSSTVSPVSCFGGADGNINVGFSGGTPGYTYSWNTGATTEDITDLSAGNYSVTVTDANGCTLVQTYVVSQPDQFVFSSNVTNVSCFGGSDGSYAFSLSGGTLPYNYTLLDGSGTTGTITTEGALQTFSNLSAGDFGVQIIDGNGCSISENVFITQPPALEVSGVVTDVLCNGDNTGEVLLTVNGGNAPYSYSWSGVGSGTDLRMGLTAGSYTVTVTDNLGCQTTETFTINEPALLNPTTVGTNPLCNGEQNGSVNLTVNGGTAPYLYNWSSGETTEDIDMVGAGTYTVTVTDDNGCTATATQIINEPDPLQVLVSQANIDCFGASTGSIDLTITGGTAGYTYTWSDGAVTTQDRNNLAAGTYTVTVTDANNCTTTQQITITQNSLIAVSGNVTDVNCFGASTGSIDLAVSGGAGSYTYAWSDSPNTDQDRTGLAAGTYTVTVTDGLACSVTATFTVDQPEFISLSATTIDPLCFGAATGSIDLMVSGGTPGYTYAWSDGAATSQDRTGLAAGTYTVTVTDNNGCTSVLSTTITEPAEFTVTITNVQDVNCQGAADGSATATTTNGSAPFSYLWSNGSTAQTPTNFGPGDYSVTVTDNNGCVAQAGPITITEPTTVIELSATTTPSYFCGTGTGSIDLIVTNGTSPFSYVWFGPGTVSGQQDQTGLAPGIYTVEVTDGLGCSATLDVEIRSTLALGDPVCEAGGATYSITFTETTGADITVGPGSYTISGNTISGIPVGTDVQVTATDPNDPTCSITLTATSPVDCSEQCPENLISVGSPECAEDFSTYSVSFVLAPGTDLTVDPMVGTIGTNEITGIPVGTNITLIASNTACGTTESVDVTSPNCCPDAPIVSIGEVVCVDGATYEYTFAASPGATVVSTNGTVDLATNTVTVVVGTNDTLTVYNRVDCDAVTLSVISPADCNIMCLQPDLTLGNAVCEDGETYSVAFTETTGAVITTEPSDYTIIGNVISGIPVGEDVEVIATNPNDPACAIALTATSPDDCNETCPDELISVSALGVCAVDGNTYSVNFVLAPGATLTTDPLVGTIGTNEVTGIPAGTSIRLIATNTTCNLTDDIVVAAPDCCPDAPIASIGEIACVDGTTYQYTYAASPGATVVSTNGTVDPATNMVTVAVGTNDILTVYNQLGCNELIFNITSPADCNIMCEQPDLTLGNGVCDGTTYSVTFTERTGATITTAPGSYTITGNVISGIPIGTDVVVTATNPSDGTCAITLTATSPNDCGDSCPEELISVSALGVCAPDLSTYSVNFTLAVGATLTTDPVVGTIGTNMITGIPAGTSIRLIATNAACDQVDDIIVAAPNCGCPTIDAPVSGGDVSYCTGDAIPSISATVPSGQTIDWYDAATGGTLVASGTTTFTPTSAGTYYAEARETASGCTSSTRTAITVTENPLPTASVSGTTTICSGDPAVDFIFTGTADAVVTYNINGGTNTTITLDGSGTAILAASNTMSSTVNLVSVENPLTNCSQPVSGSATVTVDPLPNDALAVSDDVICEGETATITVSGTASGVNYQLRLDSDNSSVGTAVAGTGGDITFSVSPAVTTTYNVLATNVTTACAVELTDLPTVTVNPLPTITVVSPASCDASLTTYTIVIEVSPGAAVTSTPAVTITDNGGDNWTLQANVGTDFVITATDPATNCQETLAVTSPNCECPVIDAPVSGGDVSYCAGDAIPSISATVPSGQTVDWYDAATGGTLLASGTTTFTPTSAGTYYAEARETASGCTSSTRTAITVTENPVPTVSVSGTTTICSGDPAVDFTFTGTADAVVTYNINGGTNTTITLDGSGTAILAASNTMSSTVNLVSVENPLTNCSQPVSGSATVTVDPLPNDALAVSDDVICEGETATITVSGTASGVNYQLRLDSDNSSVGAAVAGTGGDITFSVSPAVTTTYNVLATNATTACAVELADLSTVTVDPLPNDALAVSDDVICEGDMATITVSGTASGVNYQLRLDSDNSSVGAAVAGTGGDITFSVSPAVTTTYNVLATNATTACAVELTDLPTVTVNPLPTITVVSPASCDASLTTYTIVIEVSPGAAVTSTPAVTITDNGGDNWTLQASVGTDFVITATDPATNCQETLAVTSPNCACPTIDAPVSGGDVSYCAGDAIPAISATVPSGQTVDWYDAASGGTLLASGTTTFTPTSAGTYYAEARETASGCTSSTRTAITVTENPVPTISVVPTNPTDCDISNGRIEITATGVDLKYSINGGLSFSDNGVFIGLDPGTYEVVVMYGDCTEAFGTVTLSGPSNPTVTNVSINNPDDCDSPTGSITVTSSTSVLNTEYSIDGGQTWQASNMFTGLIAGFYEVYVRNSDGSCPAAGPIVVLNEPNDPILLSVSATDPTGCDGTNGTITAVGGGGEPPYQFQLTGPNGLVVGWTAPATEFTFTGLSAGKYDVAIRNSNGTCEIEPLTIQLDDVDKPTIVSLSTERSMCLAGGSATLFVDGGENLGSYQYSSDDGLTWAPAGGSFTFTDLGPGVHTLFVANSDLSCPVSIDVMIENACLELEKSSQLTDTNNDGFLGAGDVINFSFVVTNTGDVPITSVNITDPQLPILSGFAGTLNPGESYAGASATYTVTTADVTAGEYVNQAVASGQDPENMEINDLSDDPNDPTNDDLEGDGEPDDPTVTLIPNSQPSANDDNFTICDGVSINVDVLANDNFGNNGPAIGPITITVNASNGIATVNDNGTINDPTDDSIDYTPNAGFTGADVVTYEICDTDGDCATANLTITVTECSTVAINDINQTPENVPVSGDVSTNDFDPQGDNQTVTSALADTDGNGVVDNNLPLGSNTTIYGTDDDGNVVVAGTLTLNNNGTYTFTPATGFTGDVPFEYTVTDDNATPATDNATVAIEVIGTSVPGTNEPPVANDDTRTSEQDVNVGGNVLDNDSDPDGDPINVTGALADTDGDGILDDVLPLGSATPIYGTDGNGNTVLAGVLTQNTDGTFTFDPEPNFLGEVPMDYTISDPEGLTDDATLTILIEADSGNVTYANDDANSGPQNVTQTGNILNNDTDPEGDSQTVTSATDANGNAITIGVQATLPSGGQLTISGNGSYTYLPAAGFVGTEIVEYMIIDNGSPIASDVAKLYLTTLPLDCITVEAFVYLEGSVIVDDGSESYSLPMRTDLNDLRVLPGQVYNNFFDPPFYNPAGQPFGQAPWDYFGTEGDQFDSGGDLMQADAGYPVTVVDWVLVSLRSDAAGTGGPLCQAAALLHEDGSIELVEPFDCCGLDISGSYYLVVEHRNHLIVMSPTALPVVNGKITYDFRTQQSYIDDPFGFGTFVGQKQIDIGGQTTYLMFAGNGEQANTVDADTDINFGDRTFWEIQNGTIGRFRIGDYNMNGDINFNDRRVFEINNSKFSSVPRN